MGSIGENRKRPVLLMTHPRSRSTAFERMFLTQSDRILCLHEIFQHPFYWGSERLSNRLREEDILSKAGDATFDVTYQHAFGRLKQVDGRRVFVKDMAKMFMAPKQIATPIAPSLQRYVTARDTEGPTCNPTCVPAALLQQFHFTFLIRHPRFSIPSLYRLTQPPLSDLTGWHGFSPSDAGYVELRTLFDYLKDIGAIGPSIASGSKRNGFHKLDGECNICLIDSEDLQDNPKGIVRAYCEEIGEEFDEGMLVWDSPQDQAKAEEYFKDCRGFHMDLLGSAGFAGKSRTDSGIGMSSTSRQGGGGDGNKAILLRQKWVHEFGEEGARMIQDSVDANLPHYEYLKQFCLKV